MMFPMLNSLKLAFYVCYFVQLMHFLSIIRFLMDYAIGCDSTSIVRNRTIAKYQKPCIIEGKENLLAMPYKL